MKKLVILLFISLMSASLSAQSFEPKWVGDVHVLKCDSDTVAIPTEKANVQVKTSASAGMILVGIGNVKSKVTVKGPRSTTQIDTAGPVTLVVKGKDNDSDPTTFIQIVKFEEKKKDRRAELASVNWLGSTSEGNMTIMPYEANPYGSRSYILKADLPEGEYGVRVLNPNEKDEKVVLLYCFGIHPQDSE